MERAAASVLAVLLGCGGQSQQPGPASSSAPEVSFETLYLGLQPITISPRTEPRIAAVPGALALAPADVLCANGVSPNRKAALIQGTVSTYPYAYDPPTDTSTPVPDEPPIASPATTPSCLGDDGKRLDDWLDCMQKTSCATKPTDDGVQTSAMCGASCSAQAQAFAQTADPARRCETCLNVLTPRPFGEIRRRCKEEIGLPRCWDGAHASLVLSRLPLHDIEVRALPTDGCRTVAIKGTLRLENGAEVDLYCSEAGGWVDGGSNGVPPYPGRFGTTVTGYKIEHDAQIGSTLAFVRARSPGRRAVVLGFFATGNAHGDMQARAPHSFARLASELVPAIPAGFQPACTLCGSNPLIPGLYATWENHVFLKGMTAADVTAAFRTHLGNVVVVPGEPGTFPISVVYGFRSRVRIAP